jgi:hypothetical protein
MVPAFYLNHRTVFPELSSRSQYVQRRIDINRSLPASFCNQTNRKRIAVMRPVAFGEALPAGTRLTLFSDASPIASSRSLSSGWMNPQGVALALRGGVPIKSKTRKPELIY